MNIVFWILQGLAALLFALSGIMKVFMFDKIRVGVQSFDALPKKVWMGLGIVELLCVLGLVLPGILHWPPELTPLAAAVLALESLVFIWVHVQYREIGTIVFCCVLGLLMTFVAWGRLFVVPIL